MKKFVKITLLFMLILAVSLPAFAEEQAAFTVEPVSPQFQEWLNNRNIRKLKNNSSAQSVQTESKFATGRIPSPIDRSELLKDPPRPRIKLYRDSVLPAYYDLREQNRLTGIRDQNPWRACWVFASLGSLESTYKKSYSSANPDLSEMLIAYFAYGDTRAGKSFEDDGVTDILNQGGNADMATTFLSRLGTVNESTLPYPSGKRSYTKPSKYPENYESSGIYLKDAYLLGSLESDEMKKAAKKLIMDYGGVYVGFFMNDGPVKTNGYWAYFDNSQKEGGHAVTVVGWDDNFSRNNFPSSNRPSSNGAWLVRNSWGTGWHDSGYFWMSYEQYTDELALFIPGKTDKTLKQYGYDDLGRTGTIGAFWTANVFKAKSNEILKHVGFHTTKNNESYTIYIYDLGTSKPSSPVNGTLLGSIDGYQSYSGYHTVDFNIKLKEGRYFSVVKKSDSTKAATEVKISGWAEAVVNSGESYNSLNGTSWTDMGETYSRNACIKAFTVDDIPDGIKIDAEHFPDYWFRQYVSYYDTDGNGYFSDAELAAVTDFGWHGGPHPDNVNPNAWSGFEPKGVLETDGKARWKNIKSIEGVKYFKNLVYLYVYNDSIEGVIDVSGMTSLKDFRCYGNKITGVKLMGCTALTHLEIQNNKATYLRGYTDCKKLEYINISGNKLPGELDLQNFTALKTLIADNNLLTGLKLSGCSKLEEVNIHANSFTKLTIKGLSALKTLNVSMCDNMTELDCSGNALVTLEAMSCEVLKEVTCTNNKLTSLRLSFCPELEYVYCKNNKLKTGSINLAGSIDKLLLVARDEGVSTGGNAPAFTDISLPSGYVGESYSGSLKASGTGLITYESDVLFATSGLRFDGTNRYSNRTGKICGVPVTAGTFEFTFKAWNFEGETEIKRSIKITNAGKGPEITTSAAINLARDTEYSLPVQETGGTLPIKWERTSGNLPDGMTLSSSTGRTIYLQGKPAQEGTYTFTLRATDSTSIPGETWHLYDARKFTVKVTAPVKIAGTLTAGIRQKAYSRALTASGGASPYTWTINQGALPDGLTLAKSTGKITGKPTKAGTFNFTVKATDQNGATAAKAFTVKVTQTTLTLTVPTTIIRGKSYTWTPKASGGTSAYTWTISKGSLPTGLKINASTGKITGKPSKAGTFNFTVKVTDKNKVAATKAFTVKVTQTTITLKVPTTIVRGKSYTWTPKASGGTSAYTWSKSAGTLPNGMSINVSTGKITGKPSKAGTFKFTIKAIDKNKVAATKAFTVKVTQTTVTATIPATIVRGKSYTWTPKASGGTSAYTWSKSAGTLPNGMSINASTGKITGKPSKAGTFKFTIKAIDKNKIAATKAFTVKVTQTTVTATIPATIKRGTSYTWTPKATGGTSAYTWTISKGSLPTGMKINAGTGKITGKPTKTGTFSFTIKAKDKNGIAGTKAFSVKVTEATATTKSQAVKSQAAADFETGTSTTQSLKVSIPVTLQTGTLTAQGSGTITLAATLNVASDDVVEAYDGKDSDLVKVKANTELTFIIGEWGVDVSELTVYVDDKPVEGLTVEEGKFTLTTEMVHDDFKVSVKAQSDGVELESEEVYIISE